MGPATVVKLLFTLYFIYQSDFNRIQMQLENCAETLRAIALIEKYINRINLRPHKSEIEEAIRIALEK